MWTCKKCGRIFEKKNQMHSCKKVPLETHFENKDHAKALYEKLLEKVERQIGKVKIISLPCCIHWFGHYDFLALLPKKDKLEVRFALDKEIKNKRIFAAVPLSKILWKNCLYISDAKEIDQELVTWLTKSYAMKK